MAGGETYAHRDPNYMAVWAWLAVLTVLEIGAYYLPPPAKWVILVALALTKAALVALYFMHLRFDVKTLSAIAVTPLLIATLLVVFLLPDHGAVQHRTAETARVQAPRH